MSELLLYSLGERRIAYSPILSKIEIEPESKRLGTIAGVMLSQLLYWRSVTGENTIRKKDAELSEELAMSIQELRTGRKKLIEAGIVSTSTFGRPPELHYAINTQHLISALEKVNVAGNIRECCQQHPGMLLATSLLIY